MKSMRNSVQLVGNLGKDPELTNLEGGKKLVRFSMATTESFTDSNGKKIEDTQWHTVVAWDKKAEAISDSFKKGNRICVNGKLSHRTYVDKTGITKYITEIIAGDFLKVSTEKN